MKTPITCPIATQNLSCVTGDDCSGTKVDKHIGNGLTVVFDI